MLNLQINQNNATVQNTDDGSQWTIKTARFFGVVFSAMEKHFSNFNSDKLAASIKTHMKKVISGTPENDKTYIFHCRELGSNYLNLLDFIGDRRVLDLSLKEIEDLRIKHRMTTNYLPSSFGCADGIRFDKLRNVTDVMIAALYYYAYTGLKLIRCKHCGMWFAAKSLKEEYCDSISPCCNMVVMGKKVLGAEHTCKDAVRIIKQRFSDRKKQIYNKWYIEGLEDECFELNEEYFKHKNRLKENPSVENIIACMEYLYSERMPKQERPSRRKTNTFMRELIGR